MSFGPVTSSADGSRSASGESTQSTGRTIAQMRSHSETIRWWNDLQGWAEGDTNAWKWGVPTMYLGGEPVSIGRYTREEEGVYYAYRKAAIWP